MNGDVMFVFALASACFAAFVASAKRRSAGGWFALGLMFPLVAVFAIVVIAPRFDEDGDKGKDDDLERRST